MRLTTKGRYAVTAMLDLALNSQERPVSLADISGRQEISLSYLEQLFSKLRQNDLVTSVRGPGGGYRLKRPPEELFIAQIIDAVNESVDATNCNGAGNCQRGEKCLTHDLWVELSAQIHHFLSGISLASLLKKQNEGAGETLQASVIDEEHSDIINLPDSDQKSKVESTESVSALLSIDN